MGQSGYAENFINTMLGWIRNLASGIAGMFQSAGGSGDSTGRALLGWFSDHWLGLLIALIVMGVLIDWLVWMLRWRPYWLWLRKRRVVLDDDIDDQLTEDELVRRYGLADELGADDYADAGPRFHSAALRRKTAIDPDDPALYEKDDPNAYDEYDEEYDAYGDGDYDEGEYEDFVTEMGEDEASPEGSDELDGTPNPDEEALEEGWDEPILPTPEGADGQEWDDLPRKKKGGLRILGRNRRKEAPEEDPFEVPQDLDDLDDDFYTAVSAPRKTSAADMRLYARPVDSAREESEIESITENAEEESAPRSRRARRKMQEAENH